MAADRIQVTNVAVGTTPTLLCAANARRRTLWMFNNNAAAGQVAYLGPSTVADTDGQPLDPRARLPIVAAPGDIGPAEAWYGICSAGQSANVRVLEVLN